MYVCVCVYILWNVKELNLYKGNTSYPFYNDGNYSRVKLVDIENFVLN